MILPALPRPFRLASKDLKATASSSWAVFMVQSRWPPGLRTLSISVTSSGLMASLANPPAVMMTS